MSYTPKTKVDSIVDSSTIKKWQKKSVGGVTNLSFNNLTVGQNYRITINTIGYMDDTVSVHLWTLSGATSYSGGSSFVGHSNQDRICENSCLIFTAATTTLTLTRQPDAWGQKNADIIAYLEEVNNDNETSEWV